MFCQLSKIMNTGMKTLLLILFASTVTSVIADKDPPVNPDITSLLNTSIARTFRNLNLQAIQDLLIFRLDSSNPINHDIEADYEFEPFQNKFYFTGVNISIDLVSKSIHIRHEFSSFETTIFIPKLEFTIEGHLGATNDTVHARFLCYVHIENISIAAFKISPHVPAESKLHFNIKYNENFDCDFLRLSWFQRNITSETRFKLKQIIRTAVPQLFRENLQHNEIFSQSLEAKLCNYAAKKIASHYPDFQNNSASYHFFIPNITSLKRTLSNINITGLWNYHSLSIENHFGHFVRNLTIKNIRGHTNLSYESQNSTIFPLRFEAEFLSIVVDEEMQRVSVITNNYSVSQINSNSSLTEHQSKWVMGGIELAIASSIMPSIKFDRNWNISSTRQDHPIVKMSSTISHLFRANLIQELYNGLNITLSKEMSAESNLKLGSFNDYNISINYTTQSLPTVPIYPDLFGCALYNTFKMSSEIPWSVHGNIRLSNSTHQFDNFNFSSDKISIELTTRFNNFNENYDHELRAESFFLDGNGDYSRLYEQNKHFTEDQIADILEKTEEMLSLSILEKFRPFVKHLLSIPHLDYCTTPINMFDDFLPFFADHELPYFVHDTNAVFKTDPLFNSKINNVTITEWVKTPTTWIYYNRDNNEKISSTVYTVLEDVKVQIGFNGSSFESDKLELEFFNIRIINQTDMGKIKVKFDIPTMPSKNNLTLLKYEENWLNGRLEYMIEESFKNLAKKE